MNTRAAKRKLVEVRAAESTPIRTSVHVVTAKVNSNLMKSPAVNGPASVSVNSPALLIRPNPIKRVCVKPAETNLGRKDSTPTSNEEHEFNLRNVKKEVDDAVVDNLDCQDLDVDVLKPTKSKVYQEFDTNFDYSLKKPDYKFEIQDISTLIQQETELRGKEFRLPGFDFPVQVKCHVKYDQFQLSISFLDPKKVGKPIETRMNTKFIIILKRRNISTKQFEDAMFAKYFTFKADRWYGRFQPFFFFTYTNDIKNDKGLDANSVTVHLFVKNCLLSNDLCLDKRILQWKIESQSIPLIMEDTLINGWKEFGLTPFLYSNFSPLRVQIRLFVHDKKCSTEVRYWNETNGNFLYPKTTLNIIHPTDPTRKLSWSFSPHENDKRVSRNDLPKYAPEKSFYHFEFATVDALKPYICDNKIFVRIEI